MGWFNKVRNEVLQGGKQALGGLRQAGRAFAPKLTRRVEGWAKSAKPVFDAIGGLSKNAADVADAYTAGDLVGGADAATRLGYDVYDNAKKVGNVIKSAVGKKRKRGGNEGAFNKTGRGGQSAETVEGARPARISGDALGRLSKSAKIS